MSKLNTFALFGILFLSSVLLGNGLYSDNVQAFAQVNQTENEVEIKADIEQENKCKKDTECENENKINNSLNILNQQQNNTQTGPVAQACEDCFTTILSEQQLIDFLSEFSQLTQQEITTVQQLCDFIEENQGNTELDQVILQSTVSAGLNEEKYIELIQCLQDAGLEVDFPP